MKRKRYTGNNYIDDVITAIADADDDTKCKFRFYDYMNVGAAIRRAEAGEGIFINDGHVTKILKPGVPIVCAG